MLNEHSVSQKGALLQVKLSQKIKEFIQESTGNYGKAKLVLQKNKFFVESPYPDVLKVLLKARFFLLAFCALGIQLKSLCLYYKKYQSLKQIEEMVTYVYLIQYLNRLFLLPFSLSFSIPVPLKLII